MTILNATENTTRFIQQGMISYINERLTIGQFEYVIRHDRISHISQDNILEIIRPYVLERLGGQQDDWITCCKGEHDYYFEWKNIDNKARDCPLHRTRNFVPYRDTINITYI